MAVAKSEDKDRLIAKDEDEIRLETEDGVWSCVH